MQALALVPCLYPNLDDVFLQFHWNRYSSFLLLNRETVLLQVIQQLLNFMGDGYTLIAVEKKSLTCSRFVYPAASIIVLYVSEEKSWAVCHQCKVISYHSFVSDLI